MINDQRALSIIALTMPGYLRNLTIACGVEVVSNSRLALRGVQGLTKTTGRSMPSLIIFGIQRNRLKDVMTSHNTNRLIVCISMTMASLVLLTGCASVVVQKTSSTDTKTKGFRYYLPRPYLVVKKPFPVGGDDMFVWGTVKDDQILELETGNLPSPIRGIFPSTKGKTTIPLGEIRMQTAQPPLAKAPSGSALQQQSLSSGIVVDLTEALRESSCAPGLLRTNDREFTLVIKLSQNAGFTTLDDKSVQLGLVAKSADGSISADNLITLGKPTASTAYAPAKTDGSYTIKGYRTDLTNGADFVVALKFQGRTNETTQAVTNYIGFATTTILHLDNGKAPAVGAASNDKGAAGPDKETKTELQQDTSYSGAKLTTSGDPRTDPLSKINDYFDMLLLPDLDEQYSIEVRAGIGKATADVGLENGWMIEHAAIDIDNREIGKFIFNNLSKAIDLGIKAGELSLNPSAALTSKTNSLVQQSLTPQSQVLLRIRYSIEAQPGIYPILKSNETARAAWKYELLTDYFVFAPYPPLTVVAYNVRRYTLIEAVSTISAKADNDSLTGQYPRALTTGELTELKEYLNKFKGKNAKWTAQVDELTKLSTDNVKWTGNTSIAFSSLGETKFSTPEREGLESDLKTNAQEDGWKLNGKPVEAFLFLVKGPP